MTPRGAALLLAPLPLIALGAAIHAVLWVGIALLPLAVGAIAIDARRAPGRGALRVDRACDELLAVGVPNPVRIRVASTRGGGTRVLVRDEHPLRMTASAEVLGGLLPATLEYTLTPPARGEDRFGAVVVRAEGPMRLGSRQSRFADGQRVLVDPDLSQVRAYQALVRRGRLAEIGVRTQRRAGGGTEFERVREAVPDDPLRSINWRATARTGRLMAVELIPERAQPVVICIDHGRLMGVGAGALTKLDHAINAALLLVHVALRFGDRAGLFAFADQVTATLAPRSGAVQMGRFLDAVRPILPVPTEADYDLALAHLSGWQRRRALLVIFTDLQDPDQGASLIRQCVRLRRRHVPLVVSVRDPALDDLAAARPLDARATYARAIAGGLLAERSQTLRILQRSGVETVDADARTLSPRLVNRYLELKARARL